MKTALFGGLLVVAACASTPAARPPDVTEAGVAACARSCIEMAAACRASCMKMTDPTGRVSGSADTCERLCTGKRDTCDVSCSQGRAPTM
jgi:hypothetical protein